MQLRDLEYFSAIAEHRSVRRAADTLGMSQPGLSKSLRRLETELRAKLVARTPKGVDLTAVGAALLAQVRRLHLTFEDVAREAADLSAGRAGHLRVGANPLCADLLPAAYAILLKDAPGVTFSATVDDNDVMIPALRKGEIDLIVNYLPESPWEGCDTEQLDADYDIVVYASASHPLARKKECNGCGPGPARLGAFPDQRPAVALAVPGIPGPRPTAAPGCFRDAIDTPAAADRGRFGPPGISREAGGPAGCPPLSAEGASGQGRHVAPPYLRHLPQRRVPLPRRPAVHRDPEGNGERTCHSGLTAAPLGTLPEPLYLGRFTLP
jgi:DNA-binding transcriptional LysR family regulator